MLIAERQTRLKELLSRRGMCDLETLSAELAVSQSTVRRDVENLEQSGFVRRTQGGVIWVGDKAAAGNSRRYAFDQRMGYQLDAKRQVGRWVGAVVEAGGTVVVERG